MGIIVRRDEIQIEKLYKRANKIIKKLKRAGLMRTGDTAGYLASGSERYHKPPTAGGIAMK